MIHLTLKRTCSDEKGTLGEIRVTDRDRICFTLELPWRDNQEDISCIPPGTYRIKVGYSPKARMNVIHVLDVPGRTNIQMHPANEIDEILGCIAPGMTKQESILDDGSEKKKVLSSGKALIKLKDMLGEEEGKLTIVEVYDG
jgi:hypothetical protein